MPLSPALHHYREAFLRLLYPAHCGACRKLLELEENGVCAACLKALKTQRLSLEAACLETDFQHIHQAWALYPYESPLKEIMAGIKFYNRRWLLKVFSEDLIELSGILASENTYDWIVPIPLDSSRLMERQFNQSELIANLLKKFLKLPVIPALRKACRTPAQSGLTGSERRRNLHFAFESKISAQGKKIVLVDDILTTGATAEEAARVLKEKGAARVDLITLACNSRDLKSFKEFSPLYTQPNYVGY